MILKNGKHRVLTFGYHEGSVVSSDWSSELVYEVAWLFPGREEYEMKSCIQSLTWISW